jgi:nitrogen fixation NifU-like protein
MNLSNKKVDQIDQSDDSTESDSFDDFVASLQEERDQRDKNDFSPYALSLADDLRYHGILEDKEGIISESWQGSCGDSVTWYILIDQNQLKEIRYFTDGCTTSDIASEQLARMVDGKAISAIRNITVKDVLDALQKFPVGNHHCATLAVTSLNLALDKYEASNPSVILK